MQFVDAGEADDEFAQIFGNNLRRARESRGWSQRRLAGEINRLGLKLDPSAITRIERGSREVKLREANVIARSLRMFLDDLIDPPDVEPMVKFERVYLAAMGHLDSGRTQLAEMAESLLKAARIFDECPSLGKELDFDSELDHPMDGAAFLRRQARIFPLDDEPEMTLSVDMETLDLLRQIVVAAVHNVVAKNETSDADTASSRGS